MQTPLSILTSTGMLDWSTVLVGLFQGWMTKSDVFSFAVNWLVEHPEETDKAIIEFAGASDMDELELRSLIAHVARVKDGFTEADESRYSLELDKWRYAHLSRLRTSGVSDAAKLDELQRIYAEFGYPADMAGCSKYGPSEYAIQRGHTNEEVNNPLVVMERVIECLERRFAKEKTAEIKEVGGNKKGRGP